MPIIWTGEPTTELTPHARDMIQCIENQLDGRDSLGEGGYILSSLHNDALKKVIDFIKSFNGSWEGGE